MPVKKENVSLPRIYAKVSFGYSTKFILPYDDGIVLMSCFKNAEVLEGSYGNEQKIKPIGNEPELSILSEEEYKRIKMEMLLLDKNGGTAVV